MGRREGRQLAPRGLIFVTTLIIVLLLPLNIIPAHSAGDTWSTRHSLNTPTANAGAAALNGRIYLVGGVDISLNPRSATDVYDPNHDSWSSAASLPVPISSPGVVPLAGRLYSIGGLVPFGQRSALTGAVEVYDPSYNNWTQRTPLPRPTQGLLVAAVGGRIYAMGGVSDRGIENSTWIYSPENDTWQSGATMPAYESSLAQSPDQVAVVGGKIYVFDQSWGAIGVWAPINPSPLFNIVYDPATNTWAHWPALLARGARGNPISLSLDSMVAVGAKILVIGGNDLGLWCNGTCSIHPEPSPVNPYNFEYDTLTSTWTRRTDMPMGREGLVTTYVNGVVYAMGGSTDKTNAYASGYSDLNYAYAPCSGNCTPFTPSTPFPFLMLIWETVAASSIGAIGLLAFIQWRKRKQRPPIRPLPPVSWRTEN